MNFANTVKDENSIQKHEQGYRTSASLRSRKRRGRKRCNFKPPVNNKRLKAEMGDIKTNSSDSEKGLSADNPMIKENILPESEKVKNLISDEKNISSKEKNDSEQDDKNSENNVTVKSCTLNFVSDNIVKNLDSIFFSEDTNDEINYSNSQNYRKHQLEQHISPSQKRMNEFKIVEENVVHRHSLLEKENKNDQTIIKVSPEKDKHFLLNKTVKPNACLGADSLQHEMKELTDNDEKSAFTKHHVITVDNENKGKDENNITETKEICLNEQKISVDLVCYANIKDFEDDENKKNTTKHENLDNAEDLDLKNECMNMRKNTELQSTESVKETTNKVSLFQRKDSPIFMDELLNDIKEADAIINILSNVSNKENCTANGDMTNIQFLKDLKFNSLNKDNEERNFQQKCSENRNGLDNCTNCKNERDHSNINGTHESPKHLKNTLENECASDKIDERGLNIFQEEIGSIVSVDKSLTLQEKKLTLLYMSALDYDKEILTKDEDDLHENIETKDYKKQVKDLNDSETMDIETDSFEMKRMEININENNKNILNNLNSISSTKINQNLHRDKDELKTSEKSQYLSDTNTENVIPKKAINEVIHDQNCTEFVCKDQNQIDDDTSITRCDLPDNEENVTNDAQSRALTPKTSYAKEVSSSVSLTENSNSDSKIYLDENVTEKKIEKADEFIKNKCLEIPEMSLLVTATDYFKLEKVKNTEIVKETEECMNSAYISLGRNDDERENMKENDSFDAADSFDMDDDFNLTASQLSMIEVDEKNHIKILNQEKEKSSEQAITCANTHFNSDSVTVDIMDQLCYIRESVESIKELLSMLLKEK